MTPFRVIFAAASTLILAAPLASQPTAVDKAQKQRDHDAARQAVLRREVLPLPRILALVGGYQRGDVIEIELKNKAGLLIYDVDVLVPSGEVRALKVDARNGKLISNLPKGK